MIRGRTQAAVTVRKASGNIVRHAIPLESWSKNRARQLPLARGVLVLLETLIMGMKALTFSANEAVEDPDDPSGSSESGSQAISTGGMVAMIVIALAIGILVFFMIPLFASRGVESLIESAVVANIVEGLIRLVLFLGYIWLIGWMSDIKRVFGYHGAEHMVVAAHEAGAPLDVASVRRFSTAHPRCGTAFPAHRRVGLYPAVHCHSQGAVLAAVYVSAHFDSADCGHQLRTDQIRRYSLGDGGRAVSEFPKPAAPEDDHQAAGTTA